MLLTVVLLERTRRSGVRYKNSTQIRYSWQNILTKWHGVVGQSREASSPFEAWKCLVTDGILDNIVQHTNQYFLIIRPNFSRESDSILVGKKNEIQAYKPSLVVCAWMERFGVTSADGEGAERYLVVME